MGDPVVSSLWGPWVLVRSSVDAKSSFLSPSCVSGELVSRRPLRTACAVERFTVKEHAVKWEALRMMQGHYDT